MRRQAENYEVSYHAYMRMNSRRIGPQEVALTIAYGRSVYTRGARIFAIGRREVQRMSATGLDLRSCEGVHVVTSPEGTVITVYRNHSFKGLRPHKPRKRTRQNVRDHRRHPAGSRRPSAGTHAHAQWVA